MIIAIDGPAAAGKGTLARRLAQHFGFAFLDTGSLYRAVASKVLRGGRPTLVDEAAVMTEARASVARMAKRLNLPQPGLWPRAA